MADLGLVVRVDGLLITFEISESAPSWPRGERWIAARRPADILRTDFSEHEIDSASWLEIAPEWHHGYPQPNESRFGYRSATYDLSTYCPKCGIGLKQQAPFQMKAEPNWGRKNILQLNWIFDEYFVTPEVWARIFQPRGTTFLPVRGRGGATLKTVVQLSVADWVEIVTTNLLSEKCTECARIKYIPITRGPFPPLSSTPSCHIAKSLQFFGSGASAGHRVIVSQDLARALRNLKVRGATFHPVLPTAASGAPPRH